MPRLTARERREGYLREHAYQKKTGKSFFPGPIFHDTLVNFFFVGLIVTLACVWYYTASHGPDPLHGGKNGWLGPLYEDKSDPAIVKYDPRPEWYFFFLFQLLRIFSSPSLVLLATIIIPTLWMMMLIGMPFIDRGRERRLSRRPISIGFAGAMAVLLLVLTYNGSIAPGAAGKTQALSGNVATLVGGAPCASCHTLSAFGWSGQVGPNLSKGITYARALDRVSHGKGAMPNFSAKPYNWNAQKLQCFATIIATFSNGGTQKAAAGGAPKSADDVCAGVT
jgi:menaquinol-cytochrome c reductase cytochrome b/c subunit